MEYATLALDLTECNLVGVFFAHLSVSYRVQTVYGPRSFETFLKDDNIVVDGEITNESQVCVAISRLEGTVLDVIVVISMDLQLKLLNFSMLDQL